MEAGWNERKKSEKLADNRVTKGREFFPLFPVLIKAYEKKKPVMKESFWMKH